jgi:hypothetical protein
MPGRKARVAIAAGVLVELLGVWTRGYAVGGRIPVRCRKGHVFTTVWVPGISLKSIRLGFWRIQRCPVGKHWTVVRPVKKS